MCISATCAWWREVCRRWTQVLLQVSCLEDFKMIQRPKRSSLPSVRGSERFLSRQAAQLWEFALTSSTCWFVHLCQFYFQLITTFYGFGDDISWFLYVFSLFKCHIQGMSYQTHSGILKSHSGKFGAAGKITWWLNTTCIVLQVQCQI